MLQSPVVPEYVLQILRIERERQRALDAYIAQYCPCTSRSLPAVVARPVAALGQLMIGVGGRLEAAAGRPFPASAARLAPCTGCGD